jgi:hypothetical protein
MFTTVAEDTYMDYPYCDAGGKTVDLAIKDENMIAHVCHYVMLLTAESILVGNPNNKKQYTKSRSLKVCFTMQHCNYKGVDTNTHS